MICRYTPAFVYEQATLEGKEAAYEQALEQLSRQYESNAVYSEINQFIEGQKTEDDITLVIVKVNKP